MAAHDWAKWHLNNQSQYATRQTTIGPRASHVNCCTASSPATSALPHSSVTGHVIFRTPFHPTRRILTSSCATCHPYSGDTCHLEIGPAVHPKVQICLTRVITWSCHMSLYRPTMSRCTNLPCQHRDMPHQRPYGLYGLHSQQFYLFDFSDRMRYLLHTDSI